MTDAGADRWLPPGEFIAPPAEFAPPYYRSGYPPPGYPSSYPPPDDPPGYPPPDDPAGYPPPDDLAGAEAAPRPLSSLSAGASFLWSACALGALIGPFMTFGSYSFDTPGSTVTTTIDGWGRYSGTSTAGHGLIWGIPLIFCAAMLTIAVLGSLWRRWQRWPSVLGLVASAALVTTALGVALDAESRASVTSGGAGIETGNGGGLWLTLFVGLAAAIASLLSMRLVLDGPGQPQPQATSLAITESRPDSAAAVPSTGT